MIDAAGALDAAKKLSWALEQIATVVDKLRAKPDLAAAKLTEALDQIAKTFLVVDDSLASYLTMAFDPDALRSGARTLVEIEGGRLGVEVERGRGHCHIIQNVYQKHLDKWFSRALDRTDYLVVREVFDTFREGDIDAFLHMARITEEVRVDASDALALVGRGELDGARDHILAAHGTLRPLRLEISRAMKNLYALKNEFIEIAGALPQ